MKIYFHLKNMLVGMGLYEAYSVLRRHKYCERWRT